MRQLGFPLYVNGRLFNEPVTISHVPGVGNDPSMGGMGAYVSYAPTGLGAEVAVAPSAAMVPVEARMPGVLERIVTSPLYRVVSLASTAGLAFHGYRRNESIGWAIGWALLGGIAPVIAWPVALAQGFGKPRRGLTPNRSKKKRRRGQRKNGSLRDDPRLFVEIPPETVEELDAGELAWRDFDPDHESAIYIVSAYPDYEDEILALGAGRSLDMSDGWRIKRVK